METEKVRTVARKMDTDADLMLASLSQARSSASRLRFAWQGRGAEEFNNDLSSLIKKIENHIVALQTLSVRVSREVDEWISNDGATSFQQGSISFTDRIGNGLLSVKDGLSYAKLGFGIGTISAALADFYVSGGAADITYADGVWAKAGLIGSALDFGGKAIKDWDNPAYETLGEKAAANLYDGAFVFAKHALKKGAQNLAANAAILPAVGYAATFLPLLGPLAPVGAIAIGVTAVFAYWGVGEIISTGMENLYDWSEESGFKEAIVHGNFSKAVDIAGTGVTTAVESAADFVDNSFHKVVDGISSWFR